MPSRTEFYSALIVVTAVVMLDQAINLLGYPHAIHIGGWWRGETPLFKIPEAWH